MKLFNNHSGSRGLPCFAEGIYWATGLSLTTPFTEGRLGVNNKASPPGRHQEQAPTQRCTFSPTTFSSVQIACSSVVKTFVIYKRYNIFKTLARLDNGRTFYRALALGLSSELPTLCGQLARLSTAKLCHNQVHMTCGSHPLSL